MSSTKFRAPTFSLASSRRLPHCRSLLRTTLLETKPISRMPRHRAQVTELEKCCQFFVGTSFEVTSLALPNVRASSDLFSIQSYSGSMATCVQTRCPE